MDDVGLRVRIVNQELAKAMNGHLMYLTKSNSDGTFTAKLEFAVKPEDIEPC